VHRHLGMIVRAEQIAAFEGDRPVTERGTLRAAGNNADMLGHKNVPISVEGFSQRFNLRFQLMFLVKQACSLLARELFYLFEHLVQSFARVVLSADDNAENLARIANVLQGIIVQQHQVCRMPGLCHPVLVQLREE